jgi:hypothetical protein
MQKSIHEIRSLPVPRKYVFTLMNFVVNNQEHFQTLALGVGTIITDQLPTFHDFKKVHTMLASKSTVYHQI